MLPDRILAVKDDIHKTEGYKQAKNCITILFTYNTAGIHKLNMATLPVLYSNSARSWMTAEIFKNFIPIVRRHLCSRNLPEKAVLLLNNCSTHPAASTLRTPNGQIFVKYLSKNTTSKIQSCDAGIIKSFKALYKKELVDGDAGSDRHITDYLKELTLKDSFYLTAKAWETVSKATMRNCYLEEGLQTSPSRTGSTCGPR
ncbi:unnamed protein product [Acanthosepion pharaonis]|uniref:DDE-1 domain-containing protein n=1 Tax=Acanthosepion pharaonis TaxID=158019 RepID=A0A812BIG3_ACAPH|nr:unnamed protein product [Sepia pharaonis]